MRIERLLVVVPARDEEDGVGRSLAALTTAVAVARADRPGLAVAVVVVADLCTDATADVARDAGAHVVTTRAGRVGAARRTGVAAARLLLPPGAPDRAWVASTDADTRVPSYWLAHQLGLADAGARLVLGRAHPDPADLPPAVWQAWQQRHTTTDPTVHVHGANLGVRLDAYDAAGGWPRLREHEDRRLVDALLAAGVPAEPGLPVLTSGRRTGRTPGGFAGYLRALETPTVADHPAG